MLVFKPRPLRSDTWKPKQEFRLGPRGLSGSIYCLCRHLSVFLHGGSCSASVRMPLSREAYSSGMSSGALRFLLFCGVMGNGMGIVSLERAGQSCGVAPEAPAWRLCGPGLWGQTSKNTNSAEVWG